VYHLLVGVKERGVDSLSGWRQLKRGKCQRPNRGG
jgi:hypothetical protein